MESDTQVHKVQNTSFPSSTTLTAVPLRSCHHCHHLKACRRGAALSGSSYHCDTWTRGRLHPTPQGQSNLKQEIGKSPSIQVSTFKAQNSSSTQEWVTKPTGVADSWLPRQWKNTDTLSVYLVPVHTTEVNLQGLGLSFTSLIIKSLKTMQLTASCKQ